MTAVTANADSSDRRRWIGIAALVAFNLGLSTLCLAIASYDTPAPPAWPIMFWMIVAYVAAVACVCTQSALLGSLAGATDDWRVRGGIALPATVLVVLAIWATKGRESEIIPVMAANLLAYSFAAALLAHRLAGWQFSGDSGAGAPPARRKLSIKDLLVVTAVICLPLAGAQIISPGNAAAAALINLVIFAIIALMAIPWGLAIASRKRRLRWLLLALVLTIGPPLGPWTLILILRNWYSPSVISNDTFALWTERSGMFTAMLVGAALGTTLAVVGNLLTLQWLGLQWRRPVTSSAQK